MLIICRGERPRAVEALERAASGSTVEVVRADLSDLASVRRYCDELSERGVRLDVAVFNAGVMPRRARATAQGLEEMFAVNFLAKVVQLKRLLASGVIPNRVLADSPPDELPARRPRVIFVASEAHRSARPIEPDRLGEYVDYGIRGGMAEYAYSKLLLGTFAEELSRRLSPNGEVEVGVHWLCPGAVDSRIAREAPLWVKPLLRPVMKAFFQSPARAARPIEYLACADALEGETGIYLHMTRRREPREDTRDPENGRRLWDTAEALLSRFEL